MKLNQKQKVLRHLKQVGTLDPITALRDYSVFRLASRICELKDEGHTIKTEMVTSKNKFGEKVCFAQYTLVQ